MRNAKNSMEERLRKERPAHSAPAGFTERVMAHLPETRGLREERTEERTVWWPRFALGLAVIAIVAVFAFEFFKGPQVQPQAGVNSTESPEARNTVVLSEAVEPLTFPVSNITSEQFQALTVKLDQPLEKELENVISDTRQAIQFVASNFLPEK